MRLFYDMKSNLYNVLILKCLSKTNISAEPKQAENEKQIFLERLYCAAFQFFIQKYYTRQNTTF